MGCGCRGRKRCRHPGQSLMDDTVEMMDDYWNLPVGTECETNFHGHRVGFQDKKSENFTHVVDLDKYEFHKIIVYEFLGNILQSVVFRSFILILVLINAILIGLQTVEVYETDYGTIFSIIDIVILSIFIFEIILKWAHDFSMFWTVWWNILDFLIVCLIIASSITPDISNNSRALVIVRVVRAFRSLRSVSSLSSLAIVTHTIVKSIGDMMSILFVLMIFMIVLSVMGVTLFDMEEVNEFTNVFNSPFEAWFVLFVCITQDGWVDYMEQWRGKPYFWLLMIYIVVAIGIGAFIFSNLIIAVVVANLEMGVAEIRAEKILTQNPLANHGDSSSHIIDISPTYTPFSTNNLPLRVQRPMKLPNLRHLNQRHIHNYVQLIVALEQNMLEHSLIEADLEKVIGVVLSIAKQMEKFNPSVAEEAAKGVQIMKELQRLGSLTIPADPFDRSHLLTEIQNAKMSLRTK